MDIVSKENATATKIHMNSYMTILSSSYAISISIGSGPCLNSRKKVGAYIKNCEICKYSNYDPNLDNRQTYYEYCYKLQTPYISKDKNPQNCAFFEQTKNLPHEKIYILHDNLYNSLNLKENTNHYIIGKMFQRVEIIYEQ